MRRLGDARLPALLLIAAMIATTVVLQFHVSAHAAGPGPVVYAVNPNSGPIQGGTSVTIYGTGFTGATQVKFGSTTTSCGGFGGFFVVSSTQIFVSSPPGSLGVVDVVVVGPGGSSAAGAADKFTYVTAAVAVINGISPNHGSTAGGTLVTVDGTGFTNASKVMFGSIAAFASVISDTTLEVVSPARAAGTVDLIVINPAGASAVTNTDKFTYTTPGAPVVNAVVPNSATAAGGRGVAIEGTGFTGASAVKFGSTTLGANQFSVNGDNHIFTSAPPGTAATTVDVTVTTPAGTSAVTNADKFSYFAATAPVVRGVLFSQGPSIGGTQVNLFGSGFSGVTAVTFGGTPASGVFASDDNRLSATSPAGTVGTVHITVTTPIGSSSPSAADQFTYVTTPVPVIYGIAPNRGSVAGRDFVAIFGSGFTGTTSIHFGANVATTTFGVSDTQISVTAPAGTAGTVDVTVTTPGGTSGVSATDKFTYTAAGLPVVNSVAPNQGASAGGTFVELFGSGFTGVTAVHFGTVAATSFNSFTDTQLSVPSPAGANGTVDVTVTTPVGTSTPSAADRFTYITPSTPAVTTISPSSGPTTGGTTVWISGSALSGATSVKFGTASAFNFQSLSDNLVEVGASPAGSLGSVHITVTTAGGTSATSTVDQFTYTAPPLPAVASVGPPTGPSTGGTTVYISGSGFAGATAVNFGTNGSAFAPYSDHLITATSPAGAVGTVDITVITPGGTSSITANDQYTYAASSPPPAPVVTVVSPASGSTSGGSTVYVTGTNFTGATAVNFGINPSIFFVGDDNLITVTSTPGGGAGQVDVTVVTPSGTSAISANDHYTYVAAAAPTVTGVSPGTGPLVGGTTVWITGTGFTGASAVAFGTTGASFGVVSDTLMDATSPPGVAGTVHITVTTAGGTSATSASDQFVYGGPAPSGLQVNGVSPNHGATSGGTSVEIVGMGFTGATAVMFGSTTAPSFFFSTDTTIFTTSPAGTAGMVDVTVKVGGSTSAATNADHFTFTAPGKPVVNAVQPNHGSSAGGTNVAIFGSGFTGATSVQFGSSLPVFVFAFGDTQLNANSPAGTAGSSVDITVTSSAGTSATAAADLFTYVAPGPPVVDAVTPSSGSTLGGTSVTVFGSGLSNATTVAFGSTPTFTGFAGDTQLQVFTPAGTAGTVDVTVTTPGGTSATNNADKFTYVVPATPVVNAVSPNRGGTAGGRTVHLFGSGFSQASAVQFGTTAATLITLVNDGQLDVTSPPGAVGTVHITVTAPGGVSAAGASDQYTYFVAPAPSITAVSPSSGAPGTQVFLTGTGFSDVTSVFFGSTCESGFFSSGETDTSLQVFAPPGPTGTVDVTVVSPDGTSTVTVNDRFTYTASPLPTVTAVAPASGPSAGGTTVFVTGTGLSGVTGVTFGSAPATFFFAFDDGLIQANSPAGTNPSTVDVRVTSPGGTSAISSADQYTYGPTPVPSVTAISPTSGDDGGGTEVFVTGSGFLNATVMHFGTTAINPCFFRGGRVPTALTPKPTILTPSQVPSVQVPIVTRVPVHTPTGGAIRNHNSTPLFATVLVPSVSYRLNTGLAPQPASSKPSAPQIGGPLPCVSGFGILTDNLIDAFSPSRGTNPATVDVTVTGPSGTSSTSAADQFTYVPTPAPVVTAVSPSSGPSGGGTTVFISGSNLTNPSAVHFGTVPATIQTDPFLFFFGRQNNGSLVEAVSPAGTNPSTVDVTVTTAGGTSATSAADLYVYGATPTPTVGAVGPSSGPVGTTVFVTGTGFLGTTAVDFGTVPAIPRRAGAQVPAAGGGPTGFFVISDNLIQATSPPHAVGPVDVTVVSPGGTSAVSTADKYTYTASPTPVVSIVAPNSGLAGTSVYITGTGLTGASAVTFGAAATTFALLSDHLIRATSPAGSGIVDVTVTTPGGTSATSPADLYTLSGLPPAPTVTSVVPNTGPGAGGTSVTITGTTLNGATAVTFGTNAAAGFIVNSTTQITATSPAGSGTVDVRVTTAGGTSVISTGDKFTYNTPPPGPTVSSVAPISGPTAGGTSVTITGTNFTGASAVAFGATAAATYTVNSATQITATSPAGSGTVDVTVTTASGTSATSAADQFTYIAPPTVSSVVPNKGPSVGGTSVTITGTNFTGATAVKFGTATTIFTVNSATQITATSPAGSGTVDVTVTTAGGMSATSAADKFTYVVSSLRLSPTGIGFGGVAVGTASGPQAFTVTNNGASSVQVSASMSSGNTDQFHVVDNACASVLLAPSATCTAHFTFNPTTAGDNLARFTVSGASSGALALDLTGTGLADACASTAISTDLTSPQSVGAHVNLTATSAGCPDANPLYRFYVRDTSATWHIVQDFSTANSYLWDTTTWGQGTFLIGVWVKDANSANTYDAFAFGTFTLGLPTCSSTNMTSDVASPQAVGTTVNFTATSIGCPSPLYQWFVRDAAGNWNIAPGHDFAHSSATFAWNTTGLSDGTYQVGVWAKQTGSTASYDAFAFVTYTLTITHCTAVNLGTSVTSPQTTGAAITLTPTVTGCPSPQYRFYVRDAGGTWHIQQDFGVGTTYLWNASSTPVNTATAGTFLLGVWARQAGSVNSYDAFAFITFSLTSGATCTVNIAANKTSPQPLGTSATWTATASGCTTTPLTYQFWVNPPGGTWTIVQPFAAGNTYLWTGAAVGTYQVGVWVKQAGSTAFYDNFAFTTFTLTPTSASQVCQSVNVGAAPASPRSVGTAVTFTASGTTGCATPEFRWWVRDISATWNIVQDYPGSSTFNWSTGSLPAGTYLVGVWVRQTGSSASYEAYYFLTFTLTGSGAQACSSVNIAPSVASPQAPGTNITFTAAALGCGTPNYRFFIAPPSTGVFAEVQPFGAANTFLWHTAGLGPGPYQVGVWARQSGSTASYEAFAFITFQLQVPVCTALTLTTSPGQVTAAGTTITFTASASDCPNPQYQFYIQSPSGSFVVVQPYSSSATFIWPTSGMPSGQYGVLVVARDATSSAPFDSFAETDFTLT